MSTQLLDLDKLRAQPIVRDPFPFVVVSGMLKPGAIKEISRDFPRIEDGGVYPVDILPLGPAMKKLVQEIGGEEFRKVVEEKFGLDLQGRPTMITLRGRYMTPAATSMMTLIKEEMANSNAKVEDIEKPTKTVSR